MGNTTSCCVSSSPKHRRSNHSRLEPYRPEPELSREDTGCNLQHISDRENLDGKTQTDRSEVKFTEFLSILLNENSFSEYLNTVILWWTWGLTHFHYISADFCWRINLRACNQYAHFCRVFFLFFFFWTHFTYLLVLLLSGVFLSLHLCGSGSGMHEPGAAY